MKIVTQQHPPVYGNGSNDSHKNNGICLLRKQRLLMSGVGNIIKSEALYEAGLSPRRSVGLLERSDVNRLVLATRRIFRKVLRYLERETFDRGTYMGLHWVYQLHSQEWTHHLLGSSCSNIDSYPVVDMDTLIPAPDTTGWYRTQYGCLKEDPTRVARFHTFSDAAIPALPAKLVGSAPTLSVEAVPLNPAASSKICLDYRTAWPMEYRSDREQDGMVVMEMSHPQFAFRATVGGPASVRQVDVESQLRRLDQPLGRCQATLAPDAPLYRNTVAPPPGAVPAGVQNAVNPIAAIVRRPDACRMAADAIATAMSGRLFNNPTRQDTARMEQPFAPPGIGSGQPRPGGAGRVAGVYYS